MFNNSILYIKMTNMFINVNFIIKFVLFYDYKLFTIVIDCIVKFV